MSPEGSSVQFWLGFWKGRPPTLCPGYLSAPHGVGLLNTQGSVSYLFVLDVCAQGTLGCLMLVFLSCLCASQVACHAAFVKPGIGEAWTTDVQRRIALSG